jgi:hypothetical protein
MKSSEIKCVGPKLELLQPWRSTRRGRPPKQPRRELMSQPEVGSSPFSGVGLLDRDRGLAARVKPFRSCRSERFCSATARRRVVFRVLCAANGILGVYSAPP